MEGTSNHNYEEEESKDSFQPKNKAVPSNPISKILKDIIFQTKETEDIFSADQFPVCLNSSDLDLLVIPDYDILKIKLNIAEEKYTQMTSI